MSRMGKYSSAFAMRMMSEINRTTKTAKNGYITCRECGRRFYRYDDNGKRRSCVCKTK